MLGGIGTKFNDFVYNLDDEAPSSADDTKLEGVIDGSNERSAKVLPMRRSNLVHQWTMGADWLESSFTENELAVLVLNMSDVEHVCPGTKKTSGILGCWRRTAEITPGVLCPALGSSEQERHGQTGASLAKDLEGDEGIEVSHTRGRQESWDCLALRRKAWWGVINGYEYLNGR
ncbi:hypothetical protein QYF61_027638, partial [Mycteria americana]